MISKVSELLGVKNASLKEFVEFFIFYELVRGSIFIKYMLYAKF